MTALFLLYLFAMSIIWNRSLPSKAPTTWNIVCQPSLEHIYISFCWPSDATLAYMHRLRLVWH
jgi:hypothetical protein